MIIYKLRSLMGAKGQEENRAITLLEVAEKSGVGRVTLSHLANHPDYVTSTDKLAMLCQYFNCRIEDLVEFVPDSPDNKTSSLDKLQDPAKRKAATKKKSRNR